MNQPRQTRRATIIIMCLFQFSANNIIVVRREPLSFPPANSEHIPQRETTKKIRLILIVT